MAAVVLKHEINRAIRIRDSIAEAVQQRRIDTDRINLMNNMLASINQFIKDARTATREEQAMVAVSFLHCMLNETSEQVRRFLPVTEFEP